MCNFFIICLIESLLFVSDARQYITEMLVIYENLGDSLSGFVGAQLRRQYFT